MSKKKNKKKKKNIIPFSKKKVKRITLKAKLTQIYNTINLETTCKGNIACCKVAMPQMNYSEFCQLLVEIWQTYNQGEKLDLLCNSMAYFFRNEFEKWGKDIFLKPCMLLDQNGKCKNYSSRPLSCRMYGLWPEKDYNARVDKFEKAYEGMLTRSELPLNTQCHHVKRIDDSQELTSDIVNNLYQQLDILDKKVGKFTDAQIQNKENYRTFHDWLLWTFLGEDNLSALTRFMMGATKSVIEEQIVQFRETWTEAFAKGIPQPKLIEDIEE